MQLYIMWLSVTGFPRFAQCFQGSPTLACISTSFLFIAEYPVYCSIVWMYYILFIHSFTDGYLCFPFFFYCK